MKPFSGRPKRARSVEGAIELIHAFRDQKGYSDFRIAKRPADGVYLVFPIHPDDDLKEAMAACSEIFEAFSQEEVP